MKTLMNKSKKVGNVITPKGVLVYPHELVVATALSWTGENVTFIETRSVKTPDVIFCNKHWETKSPQGKSNRTIENNIRRALEQSENIIIDLHRMKLSETKCLKEIKRQFELSKRCL